MADVLLEPAQRPLNLGEQLRAYRIRRRMKQDAVAADLGVSQATVSRIESGALDPSPELGQTIEALLAQPENLTAFEHWRRAIAGLTSPLALIRLYAHKPDLLAVSDGLERWLSGQGSDRAGLAKALAPALKQALAPGGTQRGEITLGGAQYAVFLSVVTDDIGTEHLLVEIEIGRV